MPIWCEANIKENSKYIHTNEPYILHHRMEWHGIGVFRCYFYTEIICHSGKKDNKKMSRCDTQNIFRQHIFTLRFKSNDDVDRFDRWFLFNSNFVVALTTHTYSIIFAINLVK